MDEASALRVDTPGSAGTPSSGSGAQNPPGPRPPRVRPQQLRARVLGTKQVGESAFKQYTVFEILVETPPPEGPEAGPWTQWVVNRRFKNFEALHKRLKARLIHHSLPRSLGRLPISLGLDRGLPLRATPTVVDPIASSRPL